MNKTVPGVLKRLHKFNSEQLFDMYVACDETQKKHKLCILNKVTYASFRTYCAFCSLSKCDGWKDCTQCLWMIFTKANCLGKYQNSHLRIQELRNWKRLIQHVITQKENQIGIKNV